MRGFNDCMFAPNSPFEVVIRLAIKQMKVCAPDVKAETRGKDTEKVDNYKGKAGEK